MSSKNLENLVAANQLKKEKANQQEFENLLHSGQTRLKDASKTSLSQESQFDLAYNAAHSLALAALRWHGYRATNRFVVFQVLPYTLGVGPEVWRILAKCHEMRNLSEYEGNLELDDKLLDDLIAATKTLLKQVKALEG